MSNTLTVQVASRGFMSGAVERRNANGALLGSTLSYIGSAPAGDVRKQLAATGLKGKDLKTKVNEVLRGEKDMAWALFDGQMSVARSMGFCPIKTQSNKSGEVLTSRMELVKPNKEEQAKVAAASLGVTDLMSVIKDQLKGDDAALLALLETLKTGKPAAAEAPAIEV